MVYQVLSYGTNISNGCLKSTKELSKLSNFVIKSMVGRHILKVWKFAADGIRHQCIGYSLINFLILRPVCYQCPFANLNRPGDITIGDAWGIEKANPSWNDDKGASLVIINSEKGKQAFEAVQSLLRVQSVNIEDYMQPNLKGPSERNKDRDVFWREFSEKGFEQILHTFAKQGRKRTIKDSIVLYGTKLHLTGLIKKLTK